MLLFAELVVSSSLSPQPRRSKSSSTGEGVLCFGGFSRRSQAVLYMPTLKLSDAMLCCQSWLRSMATTFPVRESWLSSAKPTLYERGSPDRQHRNLKPTTPHHSTTHSHVFCFRFSGIETATRCRVIVWRWMGWLCKQAKIEDYMMSEVAASSMEQR